MSSNDLISIPFVDMATDKVVIRHDFEEARYSLSNMGQKVFYEILAKLDSFKRASDQLVCLRAAELERIGIGYTKSTIYRQFRSACEEVQDMKVLFYGEDEEHIYKGSINIFRGTASKFRKSADQPKLVEAYFAISHDAAPYLTELSKDMRFTQFLADQIRALKKAPSMRLYQWLRKHHWITIRRPETTVEIYLDELRCKLDYKSSYKTWKDFKLRILEPAVAEVNDISDICCAYETAKTGRGGKIISLVFSIWNADTFCPSEDPEARELEGQLIDSDLPELDSGLAAMIRMQVPGIDENSLATLAVYQKEVIMESLMDFVRMSAEKSFRDPVKYFTGIVKRKTSEDKQGGSGGKEKSLNDKLRDRSWAEGLDLFGEKSPNGEATG
ncbi:replication initiation protein [Endozoicomonas sp.]|uniref:replication initiation protein n=1 Tax=Endozoicomonas sp. TaxID=1892382 RepID=UPI00383BC0DB